jgi:DNA-binding response OmpR family regulator
MLRILLIHPRINSRSDLAIKLRKKGYDVVKTSAASADLYRSSTFDMAIIDLNSKIKGEKFTKYFRRSNPKTGIILLAESGGSVDDQIEGLLSGADACQIKPVNLEILYAYITSIARRIGAAF